MTDAIGELVEVSVLTVHIKGSVVTAEGGFAMPSITKSTSLTKSFPLKRLLTVIVLLEILQPKPVTSIRFTITLVHEYPASCTVVNWEGNVTVAESVAGTLAEFQLVGLRESS